MKKKALFDFLEANKSSSLEVIHELRKSYESLAELKDDDEIPELIQEEFHNAVLVKLNPKTPHFPFRWKQFIPAILEEDINVLAAHFTEGDLIYGLNGSRIMLFRILERNNRADFAVRPSEDFNATVDPYLNIFLNDSLNKNDPFYIPAQAFKSYASLFKPELEQFTYSGIRQSDNIPFIKKMSKLGILWALNNDHKLHFVLNNIDYKMCFEKQFDKITFSELRFLYRYWEQLKPHYEQGNINFYFMKDKQLIKVAAPWESKADIVSTYVPKYSNKTAYHAFFNSFLVELINNEIKTERWRTGLWGFGGGSSISVDGQEKVVPHRVAKIFHIANDNTLSLAARYLEIQRIAREALANPRWLQKSETTGFYQKILDSDKKMLTSSLTTQVGFFRNKAAAEQRPNVEEKRETKSADIKIG